MNQTHISILLAGTLAIAASWVLGSQIAGLKLADRTVTVRGAAEMPVTADLATWNLGLSASGDDLAGAQRELTSGIADIKTFLKKYNVSGTDIDNQNVSVSDARANQYAQATGPRFTITGGVIVRTTNLDGAQKAKNALGDLVGKGVILTNSWGPNYAFTKLSEAKLELVSKATQEARKAANQFAADSGVRLGTIRSARQGSVEVLGRDGFLGEGEQVNKVLRVVTTVDYDIR